ncbi:MAG: hypothetical protein ACO31H_07745, partial [Bacteroidia bacterium]
QNSLNRPEAVLRPNPLVPGQTLYWALKGDGELNSETTNPVMTWSITDLQGKVHFSGADYGLTFSMEEDGLSGQFSTNGILPGLYLLQLQRASGAIHQGLFLVIP